MTERCRGKKGTKEVYKVGDIVIYAGSNVCVIADIRKESFGKEKKDYYILKPVFEKNSTVYHPVDSDETKLRKAITQAEALEIISDDFSSNAVWIENDTERNDRFEALLKEKSPRKMVWIIRVISQKKKELSSAGKKIRAADEKVLEEAKRNIIEELLYVLGKSEEEIIEKIIK